MFDGGKKVYLSVGSCDQVMVNCWGHCWEGGEWRRGRLRHPSLIHEASQPPAVPSGSRPSPPSAVWAQGSMQTPQAPGWGFPALFLGSAPSHGAIGVGWQELAKWLETVPQVSEVCRFLRLSGST